MTPPTIGFTAARFDPSIPTGCGTGSGPVPSGMHPKSSQLMVHAPKGGPRVPIFAQCRGTAQSMRYFNASNSEDGGGVGRACRCPSQPCALGAGRFGWMGCDWEPRLMLPCPTRALSCPRTAPRRPRVAIVFGDMGRACARGRGGTPMSVSDREPLVIHLPPVLRKSHHNPSRCHSHHLCLISAAVHTSSRCITGGKG